MLSHTYIVCLVYQVRHLSFFKILEYDYNNQDLHYLFQYTVLTYNTYHCLFMPVTNFSIKNRPRNVFPLILLIR